MRTMKAEKSLQSLLQKVEMQERTARKRVIMLSLIPIFLAATLLWFTGYRMSKARSDLVAIEITKVNLQKEFDNTKGQLSRLVQNIATLENNLIQKETEYNQKITTLENNLNKMAAVYSEKEAKNKASIARLKEELDNTQAALQESTDFLQNTVKVDWNIAKVMYSLYPQPARIFEQLRSLVEQQVPWNATGNSVNEGFNSPRLASYLLQKNNLIQTSVFERFPRNQLIPPTGKPQVGDLLFYERGYTMFYFEGPNKEGFCVGMTPAGIVALKVHFGPKLIGYGRVPYLP